MHVYHSRWHQLSKEHLANLFAKYLPNIEHPPWPLLPDLSKLQKATVEVLEERTESTVYRIRETNQIYHVPDKVKDEGKNFYKTKDPVFIVYQVDEINKIERLKKPRFIASYDPQQKTVFDIEWLDEEPGQVTLISTLKKAKGFLKDQVK